MKYLILVCLMALAGCSQAMKTHPPHSINNEPVWTVEQQANYDACLKANMAVATAWETIEAGCKVQVEGDDPLGE
jgi:PBP1b-binding outer membrane lipoprotein LpoB